ncbi:MULTISPECIES: hypothetical protein [unclassified Pseudoclavibacter]|uniref:hypothetical protein n=1 Tax=unclassified Pseudoclavibacter TaxID=2615177 RepID=UPI0013018B8F|nr:MULTISPECIES: hypothetical protein [unclassified Pseudoclavibacter]KAB1644400.1 hypothetical protein F8O06_10140 [Pseudoclavibacter sp. CFCC 14310]KAB1664097.1 hypothetical protein F8O08_01380 [Pseudoclavibacter sp. CFCC 13611]
MPSLISFLTVLVVAVVIASVVSALYATALRLWESGQVDSTGDAHLIARTGSVVCFSLCVAIVLFTLWLIVPQFH